MPIFEYKCSECGEVTEVLERAGSQGQPRCPKCGSRKTEKLFSAFAFGGAAPSSGDSCSTRRSGFK